MESGAATRYFPPIIFHFEAAESHATPSGTSWNTGLVWLIDRFENVHAAQL